MLIGIDASRAVYPQPTGTENYSLHLIRGLLAHGQKHRFRMYFQSPPSAELFPNSHNWEPCVIPLPRLWTHLGLSWEVIRHPPDVLFIPSHVLPVFHPSPSVVTVHDLGYLYFPQAHLTWDRFYLNISTRYNTQKASHIITVSQSTKQDLIQHYSIVPEKITVIYPGVDPALFAPAVEDELHRVREKYRLPENFILYVGTIQPRKNLGLLIEAYRKISEQEDIPHLVLAGKKGWLSDSIYKNFSESGRRGQIHFPGYIAPQDLGALLKGARLFVFPSLYEGFGLPVLEAMAAGIPVVAANSSSIPEVVGGAALLIDPHDTRAWAEAMAQVLGDERLREELVARGRERAKAFTWEKCAEQILAVLEKIGRTSSP